MIALKGLRRKDRNGRAGPSGWRPALLFLDAVCSCLSARGLRFRSPGMPLRLRDPARRLFGVRATGLGALSVSLRKRVVPVEVLDWSALIGCQSLIWDHGRGGGLTWSGRTSTFAFVSRRPALVAVGVAIAVLLAACDPSSRTSKQSTSSSLPSTSTSTTTTTERAKTTLRFPASFGVGIRTVSFTDRSRTTENYATSPPSELSPVREIVTQIRYPTLSVANGVEQAQAIPASKFGPFPVILFAHGYAVMPNTYEQLLDAWVRAGFVVVAPVFPVTNYYEWMRQGGGSAPEADVGNQPADIAFALGQLSVLLRRPSFFLHGIADLQHLGLAGQSDGATSVGGLVYASYWRRYSQLLPVHPLAMALLSGGEFEGPLHYADPSPTPAVLSVESNADDCNVTQDATVLYKAAAAHGPRHWFLTLENADHIGPYQGRLPWAPVVRRVTTDFFELELGAGRRPVTPEGLAAAGEVSGVSSLSAAASVTLPPTSDTGAFGIPTP
jgi:hypothetical protein